MNFKYALIIVVAVFAVKAALDEARAESYSSTIFGPLGLNMIPSARMDEPGTIKIGVSSLDPYAHSFIGIQLAKPLYINIRQTAEISNINEDADRLYPGVDFKLRLLEENRSRPEIAIGLNSLIGHKRMAGEYISLSKRYHDFDFTAGLGWGRMGTAGHFKNPLKNLHHHFGKKRQLDGEMPNEPNNWFTGEKIGLFGGVEYFTPIEGLSLKFDYGADRFEAEQSSFDFNVPSPWSFGAAYQPAPWVNMSIAMQGTDKVMGRLSLQSNLAKWKDKLKPQQNTKPLRPYRTGLALPSQMELAAAKEGVVMTHTKADTHTAETVLALNPYNSSPYQIGRTATHMANHAGPAIEKFIIRPSVLGLQGPSVSIMRKDLENALGHHKGSADEVWQNTEFNEKELKTFKRLKRYYEDFHGLGDFEFILDNQFSLAEEDSGFLYRNSVLMGQRVADFFGLLDFGYALRLNTKDNLERINKIRPRAILPVRSNIDEFAERTFALDKFYNSLTHSFRSDLHLAVIGGYLEEMYAGLGSELLYRPFGSRFAFGLET